MPGSIVWFRQDLRLSDNPALSAALDSPGPLIPVYIFSSEIEHPWELGAASCWWLHHSLKALDKELRKKGSGLILRKGEPLAILKSLSPDRVLWNCRYEPYAVKKDEELKKSLEKIGVEVQQFHGSVLYPPGSIMTLSNKPYQVFTPFWNACRKEGFTRKIFKTPSKLPSLPRAIKTLDLEDLKLLPKIDWAKGFSEIWEPGEEGGLKKLASFKKRASHYAAQRDIPSSDGVSHLSPHLHFGEISPGEVFNALHAATPFLRQIVWREFANHLLYFFPKTSTLPLREEFRDFPWVRNSKLLRHWEKGKTGYPIVDAGMRQLWKEGWMHNRVRMIVASFLTKDLGVHWLDGARWFWDTLVDADLANNTFGWQWAAGCGADAAPYFRIFNPVSQGEKFDSKGEYVRHYVPELKKLPEKWIHRPWEAPEEILEKSGVILGKNYPKPIIDHDQARKKTLEEYYHWKKKK